MSDKDAGRARGLFEKHLDSIQQISRAIAARRRLLPDQREDFFSFVHAKLLENDSARIRRFRGQSSLKTYLTVVIERLFLDFQRRELGTWRSSARARAMGKLGEKLERHLHRDGLSFDEVQQTLAVEGTELSRDELWTLAESLPGRRRPRFVELECIGSDPADDSFDTEREASWRERDELRGRVELAVREAMRELPARDELVLRMWFERGCTAPHIARAIGIPPREVYGIVQKSTNRLRRLVQSRRIDKDDVMSLLREGEVDMTLFAGGP